MFINVRSFFIEMSKNSIFALLVLSVIHFVMSTNLGFTNQRSYLDYLQSIAKLPQGFSVGTTRFSFSPYEVANKVLPMNLTLIISDEPTDSFAACLTTNAFPGGPIYIDKERLEKSTQLQAIIINNKISNVCPGGRDDYGAGDSDLICDAVSKALKLPSKKLVFPSSTGIIGWRLPVVDISNAIPQAVSNLQKDSIYPAALSITTTDRYPKVRSYVSKDKKWMISGIGKGAGMIEPNMATMLCYILTDLDLPREFLQQCLSDVVNKSFNCITVDGDQSTSDTVLLLSSKKVIDRTDESQAEFKEALLQVCLG